MLITQDSCRLGATVAHGTFFLIRKALTQVLQGRANEAEMGLQSKADLETGRFIVTISDLVLV